MPDNRPYRIAGTLAALAAAVLSVSCHRTTDAPDAHALDNVPRIEEITHGEIKLTFTIEPPRVQLHRDVSLTLEMSAPSEVELALPPLDDRLRGFILNDSYEDEPVAMDGRTLRRLHVLLTPLVADEYRLAPIPVSYSAPGDPVDGRAWFPTRPILFETVPPFSGAVPGDIDVNIAPVWIYPSFQTVALWIGLGLLGVGLLFVLWKLLRRIRREVQVRRMSPRERALRELRLLLGKHLIENELIKDFYVELTMIVRRYIERQHSIKAPEQTTEEFLAAVAQDARFTPATVARLRAFLQAADLVKFAAYHPESGAVDSATATAQQYIESDAAAQDRPSQSREER